MIKDHYRPDPARQDDKQAIQGNIQAEIHNALDKAVKQGRISKANSVWIKTKIQKNTDLTLIEEETWQ